MEYEVNKHYTLVFEGGESQRATYYKDGNGGYFRLHDEPTHLPLFIDELDIGPNRMAEVVR